MGTANQQHSINAVGDRGKSTGPDWDQRLSRILARMNQQLSLTRQAAGQIIFPAEPAEAGVTIVNYAIPSYAAIGVIIIERYGNNSSPGGTVPMDGALASALLVALATEGAGLYGIPIMFLADAYLLTQKPALTPLATMQALHIYGQGDGSQLYWRAGGASPTPGSGPLWDCRGLSGILMHDFAIYTDSAHKNDGIWTGEQGSPGTDLGIRNRFERITYFTAGNGIVVADGNSDEIIRPRFWPDDAAPAKITNTVTNSDIGHGVYLTGRAGPNTGFANSILIDTPDLSCSVGYRAGQRAILADAANTISLMVRGGTLVGESNNNAEISVEIFRAQNFVMDGVNHEQSRFAFHTCSGGRLVSSSSDGTNAGGGITFTSNCINNKIGNVNEAFLNIADSTCINNHIELSNFDGVITAWSAVTTYSAGQLVSRSGVNYLSIAPSLNQMPPNGTYWQVITNQVNDAAAPWNKYTKCSIQGATFPDRDGQGWTVIPYTASMTPDLSVGKKFLIVATNNTGFTLNDPVLGAAGAAAVPDGMSFMFKIMNTSGGALGTLTPGAQMAMSVTTPADTKNRTWVMTMDKSYGSGDQCVQTGGTFVDIPN